MWACVCAQERAKVFRGEYDSTQPEVVQHYRELRNRFRHLFDKYKEYRGVCEGEFGLRGGEERRMVSFQWGEGRDRVIHGGDVSGDGGEGKHSVGARS